MEELPRGNSGETDDDDDGGGSMTRQAGQITLDEALSARDEALDRVERNAADDWKARALEAVRRTALALDDFISDDVWSVGGLDNTREDRALGPIFLSAARSGWIEKTDRVRPSARSHGSGKPIWRSRLR